MAKSREDRKAELQNLVDRVDANELRRQWYQATGIKEGSAEEIAIISCTCEQIAQSILSHEFPLDGSTPPNPW